MKTTFENIKKYTNFIENRIMTEIIENPEQYDKDIEFWMNQYNEIEDNLRKIVEELCLTQPHPAHKVIGSNMIYVYINIIEQKRGGMMNFEEFLELIRTKNWGDIKQEWYGYYINCFNAKIAEKCSDIVKQSNKYATIERVIDKIQILDFDNLNSYLKGYVDDQIEKNKDSCVNISVKTLKEFNEYSNDFYIFPYGYGYKIRNLAKMRENREKEKEIDEIIDFLF